MKVNYQTRNSEALASFTEYCQANPRHRFWQALRNWSEYPFILGSHATPPFPEGMKDTFFLEGMDGTREQQ